jgi:NAD(P)-dependent dehydrogenase (short-subunit alcohol dehydrogenase family)
MSNPYKYEGKRVVVTGAATGVGAGLLDVLAEQGCTDVTVLDIKVPSGPHATYLETNLSEEAAVDAAIAAIDGPVHALFNNAGVADTMPPRTVIAVNWLALRKLSLALLPQIPEGGAIVNTASTAGGMWSSHVPQITAVQAVEGWDASLDAYEAADLEGVAPYFFSKELVQYYTMVSSRATMAKGVRTNSVCPSPIDTPLLKDFRETMSDKLIDWNIEQGMGRPVTGREVGLVLAFLGSDAAAYVNGVNMLVDGGFTAAMTTGQVDFAAIS